MVALVLIPYASIVIQADYDRGGSLGRPGSLDTVVLESRSKQRDPNPKDSSYHCSYYYYYYYYYCYYYCCCCYYYY